MEGSIVWMLAWRATRLMQGSGGASESREVVAKVVGSAGAAVNDIVAVIIVSGL